MNNNNQNTNYPPYTNNNPQPNYNNDNYNTNPNYNQNTYSTYNQSTYSNYSNGYNNNSYNSNNYTNPQHNHNYDSYPTSNSKKNKPSTLIFMGLMFLLAGILVTAVQFSERQKYNDIVDDGNSSTAYVTDVDKRTKTVRRKRSSNGRRRTRTETYYYVTATYTVDEQNYPISFESSSSYSYGDTFTVFYEDGNPSNYVREGNDGGSPILGISFVVIGGAISVYGIKKYRDEKDLKAMGLL